MAIVDSAPMAGDLSGQGAPLIVALSNGARRKELRMINSRAMARLSSERQRSGALADIDRGKTERRPSRFLKEAFSTDMQSAVPSGTEVPIPSVPL